jgi:hypothetical protein
MLITWCIAIEAYNHMHVHVMRTVCLLCRTDTLSIKLRSCLCLLNFQSGLANLYACQCENYGIFHEVMDN